MCDSRELSPWSTTLVITNTDEAFLWEQRWQPCTGVTAIDLTADVRNRTLGTSAAMAIKPAIQFAPVRTDRPDAGAAITAGSVITAEGITHFHETLSSSSQFFFRRGWSYKLTAGSFASVDVIQYGAFQSKGRIFPARDIVFQPNNDTTDVSYFPLVTKIPTAGVSFAKAVVILMDNANSTMEYRLAGRAYHDPLSPGGWTDLDSAWTDPSSGDSGDNTGELDLSGLSLGSQQWMDLALAVRKSSSMDSNSRVIIRVVPAIKYL